MYGLNILNLSEPQFRLISKILRRKDSDNLLIEAQNLLASSPINSITRARIDKILKKYNFTLRKARPQFRALYAKVMRHFILDNVLADDETQQLAKLQALFQLSPEDVRSAEQEVTHKYYEGAVQAALLDGHLSEAEKQALATLAQNLRIPKAEADRIYRRHANAVIKEAVTTALSDHRLTPDEEAMLQRIADNLSIKVTLSADKRRAMDRFRMLWRLSAGQLPDLPVKVALQKHEQCVGYMNAASVTEVTRAKGKIVSVPLSSFKLMRDLELGKKYVAPSTKGSSVQDGTLYLTTKRILFDCTAKPFSIPLQKIAGFKVYRNAVLLELLTGKNQVFVFKGDAELMLATMEGLLQQK